MQKFRPVYAAIEEENYILAIQICDKALLKAGIGKDATTLQALKALAMVRSGQYQAGYDLAFEVKRTKPLDPHTLQAVFLTFKMLHMYDDIVSLYHTASSMSPGNEEWANHWFMALARKCDWKSLQMAAVKLNKEFNTPKYYFWMVISIYLQAVEPNAKNQSILLTLAERMMDKASAEGKITNFEELQLYILILEFQKKYTQAVALMEGNLGALCKVENERKKICVGLLGQIDDDISSCKKLSTLSKAIVLENYDDWAYFKCYIDSTLRSEEADSKELEMFIEDALTKQATQKRKSTAPLMAKLYYYEKTSYALGMAGTCLEYVKNFGYRSSCFEDLYPMLKNIPLKDFEDLIRSLDEMRILDLNGNDQQKTDQIRLNINTFKIERYFNRKSEVPPVANDEIEALFKYYQKSLVVVILDERERQIGDDLLLLAAHSALDGYFRDRVSPSSLQYLIDAILILEQALSKSKFNYAFKILLARIYFEIGISQRSLDLSNSLDIKNIQLDTLSYLFTDGLEYYGNIDYIIRTLRTSLAIYDRNEIETPEMILQAFKFGTFSKIPEFIDFKRKVHLSVQKAIVHRQVKRLELLQCSNWAGFIARVKKLDISDLALDGGCPFLNIQSLSDNRDYTLLARFSETSTPILEELRGETFPLLGTDPSNHWIQLHSFIPLIYLQAFGDPKPDSKMEFMATVEDFQLFLESAGLNPLASLAPRFLLLLLKSTQDGTVASGNEALLSEIETHWTEIEAIILSKSFHLSLPFCKQFLELIEAWNAAIAFAMHENDREWKITVTRQLKNARKVMAKAEALLSNATSNSFESRFVKLANMDKSPLEYIQRGWGSTMKGLINLLDGRIGMLN